MILFISNSHFNYLLTTIHVMDVTIDYLTCTEYVKLRPQQFFGIKLYWVALFYFFQHFFTGTVFIIISGFQIIAELK